MHFCVQLWMVFHTFQRIQDLLGLPIKSETALDASSDHNSFVTGFANVAQRSSFIEGDIKLAEVDPYENAGINLRNAVADKAKVWTNATVPYTIDGTFFAEDQLATIKAAMDEIHEKTCVRFVRRTTEMPYLFITDLTKCWSEIGMPPEEGIRTLSLDATACVEQQGTIVHELLHILGFWHEQNRPDRDAYVIIHWENIADGMEHNFMKYSANKMDTLDEPYDYNSIMHYASFAFSKDDKKTIEPRIPVMIGQRFALSSSDVRKIKKLYGCSSSPSSSKPIKNPLAWIFDELDDGNPISSSSSSPSGQVTEQDANHRIVFPPITELVPLPFRFNWSDTRPIGPANPGIVFPSEK